MPSRFQKTLDKDCADAKAKFFEHVGTTSAKPHGLMGTEPHAPCCKMCFKAWWRPGLKCDTKPEKSKMCRRGRLLYRVWWRSEEQASSGAN